MGDAMNGGARLGLAVTAGYVLGRSRKMKWTLAIAALAGRGRLPTGPGGLLQQGAKALASSPEATKRTDEMRGLLVEAGKAAAIAAVSSKINSLSDGLRERSDAMRAASAGGNRGAAAGDEEDSEDERHRDEDRAAASGRERYRDEGDDSRVPPPRRPASRTESDRARARRQSRDREDTAARRRASHPSRRGGGGSARSGAAQPQDGGRPRPRSSASGRGESE
jgi:hypothetical protein